MAGDHQLPLSSTRNRSRILAAIADFSIRNPRPTLFVGALLLVLCALIAWGIPINTSRFELVASDNPHQAKLLRFFDRFGYPDAMVLVVTGGTEADRRAAVDTLSERLEDEPGLGQRVLGRLRPEVVAEVLLLMAPSALGEIRKQLGDETTLAEVVEGGIPTWIQLIEDQINRGLEGDAPAPDPGTPDKAQDGEPAAGGGDAASDDDEPAEAPPADEAAKRAATEQQAEQGLTVLTTLLSALEAELTGRDAMKDLPALGTASQMPRGVGVDGDGYLVGGDGAYNMIALFPDLPGPQVHQVRPLVDRIRAIRDGTELGPVRAQLTGMPALVTDELHILMRGLVQTSIATTIGIIVLLFVAFRSKRYTVLGLMPLAVGILLTLAAARLGWGQLNLVTSSFIPVLLALGIGFAVFILNRYGEYVRAGADARTAIRGAVTGAGPGVLIAATTTILAFLTLATTEFTAYAELGVLTAVGLLLMLGATFLLLPALLWVAGRGRQLASPELPGVRALPGLVRSKPWVILAVAAVLVAVSPLLWTRISFNARYFDFLPSGTESAAALERIERDSTVSPIQAGVVAEGVEEARAVTAKLRELETVAAVQTPTDLLPPLTDEHLAQLRAGFAGLDRAPDFDKLRTRKRSTKQIIERLRGLEDALDEVAYALRQAGHKTEAVATAQKACASLHKTLDQKRDDDRGIAAIERTTADLLERAWSTAERVAKRGSYLPEDLPPVFQARFMSRDGKALAVYANPAGNIWDTDTAGRFRDEVLAAAPDASGMAVNIVEHIRMIKEGFIRAAGLSAACVLIVLLAGFRRFAHAGLALVPVLVGFCWTLGLMGLFGIDFDVANVVILPLVLGIGIDAGGHMVHRWRQAWAENGGLPDLGRIIRGTGAAVLLASLTTAVGFAALITGDYGAMKSLGLVMTIGIGCCLVASLLVLPAILLVLRKTK